MNKQAAGVCSRNAKRVLEGKLNKADALSQVRSSLLGDAPSACR